MKCLHGDYLSVLPCEAHHVYSFRASQFHTKIGNRFQIDAVSPFQPFTRQMKLLFSKQHFQNNPVSIWRPVNERGKCIESDAGTIETMSV